MIRRSLPVSLVVVASLLSALAIVAVPARAQGSSPAVAGACLEVEVQGRFGSTASGRETTAVPVDGSGVNVTSKARRA